MTAHRAMHLVSRLPVLLAAFLAAAPQHALGDDFPWLDTLDAGGNVQASGTKLIALPLDLHRLDRDDGSPSTATIAVHGWNSAGYEWIYLLKALDDAESSTWFWRWDWNGCPGTAADALSERLSQAPFTDLDRIRLIGHSYGGVLVTVSAERWQGSVPLDVHAIAAPLAGVGDRCPYQTTVNAAAQGRLPRVAHPPSTRRRLPQHAGRPTGDRATGVERHAFARDLQRPAPWAQLVG